MSEGADKRDALEQRLDDFLEREWIVSEGRHGAHVTHCLIADGRHAVQVFWHSPRERTLVPTAGVGNDYWEALEKALDALAPARAKEGL